MPKLGQKRTLPTGLRKVLAQNVAQLMAAHKIGSPEELAARAGFSRNTAWRILKADHDTGLDNVQAIADSFGIEAWKLLQGQEVDLSHKSDTPTGVTRHSAHQAVPIKSGSFAMRITHRKKSQT